MRIKKYLVQSLPEAMEQIRSDLGHEAIILNTKKVKTGGFFGLFSKQQIEVIAALDPEAKREVKSRTSKQALGSINKMSARETTLSKENVGVRESIFLKERVEEKESNPLNHKTVTMSVLPKQEEISETDVNFVKEEGNLEVITEIKNIKKFLFQIMTEQNHSLAPSLKITKERLNHHAILSELGAEIISKLMLRDNFSDLSQRYDERETLLCLREEIIHFIQRSIKTPALPFSKVTCFIGPTGVGKTTTIAKLAADLMLKSKKKVGFITTDTYRIAAVEQLKTYAGILNIPLEVVYSPDDLTVALQRLASCDSILMDTAGRNYLEEEYVNELKHLLDSTEQLQNHLVLSLTAKYSDLKYILNSFRDLKIDSVLFTKLDETRSYGTILNVIYEFGYPVTYLTNGQNVPDDIILASPELIADLIVGEEIHA